MQYPVLDWIRETWAGQLVRDVFWVAPTLEGLHFVGMALLAGGVCIVDLSVLGVVRDMPVARLNGFLPWVLVGFGLNLGSGLLLFAAAPYAFAFNRAFQVKMGCILLAGVNAAWFRRCARASLSPGRCPLYESGPARLTSALSLFFWLVVIVCARLIPFIPNE
jgi:hypothetical protein